MYASRAPSFAEKCIFSVSFCLETQWDSEQNKKTTILNPPSSIPNIAVRYSLLNAMLPKEVSSFCVNDCGGELQHYDLKIFSWAQIWWLWRPQNYDSHHFRTHQPIQWPLLPYMEVSAFIMFPSFSFFSLNLSPVCSYIAYSASSQSV